MKKSIIYSTIICSFFIAMVSCKKKDNIADNNKWIYADTTNNVNVRLVHCFAGNTPQLPSAAANTGPQVYIYANGAKLNGNPLSYGGQWPSPSVYASIPQSGTVRLDFVMARQNFAAVPVLTAPIAGDTLITINTTLQKAKSYSIYFGDTVGGPYKIQVVEDQISLPAYQRYKIRLANYIMNPLDTLDLFSARQNANIATGITHKNISNWIELDVPVIQDTLYVRKTGQTTNYITVGGTLPSFVPAGLRLYTIVARGKTGVPSKGISANIMTNR
jgi:hypothetical protein